jgi:hypothetical protein
LRKRGQVRDGVSSEPLSGPNSLLIGKFTGNITIFGLGFCGNLSTLLNLSEFLRKSNYLRTIPNRELTPKYQGIAIP